MNWNGWRREAKSLVTHWSNVHILHNENQKQSACTTSKHHSLLPMNLILTSQQMFVCAICAFAILHLPTFGDWPSATRHLQISSFMRGRFYTQWFGFHRWSVGDTVENVCTFQYFFIATDLKSVPDRLTVCNEQKDVKWLPAVVTFFAITKHENKSVYDRPGCEAKGFRGDQSN